jgi:hypothetical protein
VTTTVLDDFLSVRREQAIALLEFTPDMGSRR